MLHNRVKKTGQVFTPTYLVELMLDYTEYRGCRIIGKHVIDNSCGDGAFLKVVVKRYCMEALKAGKDPDSIKKELEACIHGIDTDGESYRQCIANLDAVAHEYGIDGVVWDLYNQSSLSMKIFNGRMDYVVGNPPYVRVHNLDDSYDEVKQFRFANGGMTDMYLVFFELGFNMLSQNGVLCYITPSSWFNSIAAHNMRNYILTEGNLVSITDLGHYQPFKNATAYTAISLFAKNHHSRRFDYYLFNAEHQERELCARLTLEECYIDDGLYLSDSESLKSLREVKTRTCPTYVNVKNGFATLADDVFIGDHIPQTDITINVLKASTGKWYKCLFPYNNKGKLLPPDVVFSDTSIKDYFAEHKEQLLKGRKEYPTFYEYGRTQALTDVSKEKVAINTLLRTKDDIKIKKVGAGSGIYSGLYVISRFKVTYEDIKEIIVSDDFVKYIKLLKKYKSGGYYTFNSKDVQQYINYYITYKSKKQYVDQSDFFGEDTGVF